MWSAVIQGVNEAQPTMTLVAVTVAHLAVGALILALTHGADHPGISPHGRSGNGHSIRSAA